MTAGRFSFYLANAPRPKAPLTEGRFDDAQRLKRYRHFLSSHMPASPTRFIKRSAAAVLP